MSHTEDIQNGPGFADKDIPCFRCGVCCSRYQVCLSLVEARRIADELALDWDKWLERYTDSRWPGGGTLLLRQGEGGCVFLEHAGDAGKTICRIHHVRPAACQEWMPGLHRKECREGLARYWGLAVNPSGQLEGPAEKLRDFFSFIHSLEV